MRANTPYRRGEWSEVIVISHGSISPSGSCETNSTEEIITEDSGNGVTNSTEEIITEDSVSLVPVMIAAGVLVTIIVLVTLTVGIVGCTRLHRRKIGRLYLLKRPVSSSIYIC